MKNITWNKKHDIDVPFDEGNRFSGPRPALKGECLALEVNHGIQDSKGRELGSDAILETADHCYLDGKVQVKVSVRIYSLRDGEKFGAIPRASFYESVDLAKSETIKKLQTKQRKLERESAKTGGVYLTGRDKK